MLVLTKRQLIAGAAGATLLSGRSYAQDLPPHEQTLYDAAKKEGELTWYSGQLQAETAQLQASLDSMNETLDTIEIRPKKTNIAVRYVALAWVPKG